eukprot:11925276-Alexandrium_andersonii.AAC.1
MQARVDLCCMCCSSCEGPEKHPWTCIACGQGGVGGPSPLSVGPVGQVTLRRPRGSESAR